MIIVKQFNAIKPLTKVKSDNVNIDNFLARLNYKYTTVIFFICTVLVTSQELIGEHIRCMSAGIPEHVLNRFCFFTTTFTVVRDSGELDVFNKIHPGVGNYNQDDKIVHHAYYQWVPFVLFLQGLMFYGPHYLWRRWERGELRNIVNCTHYFQYSFLEKEMKITDKKNIPKSSAKASVLEQLSHVVFRDRTSINRVRAAQFLFCECLYCVNTVFQMFVLNWFFEGKFFSLGKVLMTQGVKDIHIFDQVFPKITKCDFYKYGPSGSIQRHDALCVMALNIINEKIYAFLWFWFVILLIVSLLGFIWRIATIALHTNVTFNKMIFSLTSPGKLDLKNIVKNTAFADWLYLVYLSQNMDKKLFKDFINYMNRQRQFKTDNYDYHLRETLPISQADITKSDKLLDF